MKKPTSQQLGTILQVIDRIAPRYTFGYYDIEDIKQESYIICLEGLEKYDESRPFENFISKHLSNRLKSLIRDKYTRTSTTTDKHAALNQAKKNLVDLKPYSGDYEPVKDFEKQLINREAIEYSRDFLSPSMRNDLDRLLNDVTISSSKRATLFTRIKEILGEDW